ncbi:Outer membrane protein assembly factor YaeT precursor [Coxiella-like endosymbiont]|nr:Outer membrane protein assembly factor YaeT precursor [Coxiella-like endosymbiont]
MLHNIFPYFSSIFRDFCIIEVMKNYLSILSIISLFYLSFSSFAWARISPPPVHNTLEVQILGFPLTPLENVFKRLAEKQIAIQDEFTIATIMKFYREIPKEIKEAIKPYGYFKPYIHSYIQRCHSSLWYSHFVVNPGPRMYFTHVKLQIIGPGSFDKAFQQLYKNFPIKAGNFFDSQKYEQAKNDLFNVAATQGFFKAKILKSQIQINLSTYRTTVTIIFNTGPRFHFGVTHFSYTPFSPAFMNHFLQYHKGDYFSEEKVKQTREGLVNCNYFSTVIVTPEPEKAIGLYVPVTIHLHTEPKKQYSFGLGYGTDTRVRALIRTNFRWINPYGDRFNAYLRTSSVNSALVANYYIPGGNPIKDQYVLTADFLNQDQDVGKGRSERLTASYQTNLNGWQQTISLTALQERYNLTGLPRTNAKVLYPSALWQHIHADNLLNPKRGYSIIATISAAAKGFLSKTSFLQSRINSRFLFTAWDQTRFILRNSLGYTAIKNIVNLPLSFQFLAGGAQNLRGYSYNSIGPGRSFLVGSFEIQQKIMTNLYLAAFIDAGNVSNQIYKNKLKVDVGLGLVMLTPIGMFEVTIANPISEPKKRWVIQFSMGSPL